jgi:hypothetical protein
MKIIITIGMVIIFISAFFMLFIFDTVVKDHMKCMLGIEDAACSLKDTGTSLAIGLSLITIFLIIDSVVLYIIFRTVMSSGSSYVSYSARPYP